MDGIDSKTLGNLPELDDTNLPGLDSSAPDLESFVDLMEEVKKTDELVNTPVTTVVKPVSNTPTVAVVKTSAKITPIIITEIKPAVSTTPKPTVRVNKQEQLVISEEERKMLEEEGHVLPTNVALTKVSWF